MRHAIFARGTIVSSFPIHERLDAQVMKGWLSIIVGIFLAFGVTAGAMAHATEVRFRTSAVVSVDSCESASKKSDNGQSDPSKASIKFHGCHGHHIGIPVGAAPQPEAVRTDIATPARITPGISPPTHSDTFRPPIA
ncbi:hypothetical protein C100_16570 [Sphingobium sp. C100]|jgi:hypothetical protein|nr:hypothetical protein C100_16570 [Sphingobium sp. C100]